MLDGFVVPHAQFRVFHGNFAAEDAPRCKIDQLSQFCSPQTLEALPTDLHVREFLQLEAQLKALQQQQQLAAGGGAPLGTPSSSPAASATSGTAIVSHRSTATMIAAGAQVECLTFYERLFTLESLVWPDFITTVTTKLTEHFALSETNLVKRTILRVFEHARAHLRQVRDSTKLVANIVSVLNKADNPSERALALHMLATMPTLLTEDTATQAILVSSLDSIDEEEKLSAVLACEQMLAISSSFCDMVWGKCASLTAESAALLRLVVRAARTAAERWQLWQRLERLYPEMIDDRAAMLCIINMASLAQNLRGDQQARHLAFIKHVISHDPRSIVKNCVISTSKQLVCCTTDDQLLSSLATFATQQLVTELPLRLKLSVVQVLEKIAAVNPHCIQPRTLEDVAALIKSKDARFGCAYVRLLASCAEGQLRERPSHQEANGATSATFEAPQLFKQLLRQLHSNHAKRCYPAWSEAVRCVGEICRSSNPVVAQNVVSFAVELLIHLIQTGDPPAIEGITVLVSHLSVIARRTVQGHSHAIQSMLEQLDNPATTKARHALTIALLRAWMGPSLPDSERPPQVASLITQLTSNLSTQEDGYALATEAMLHGFFGLASSLLEPGVSTVDHECFGNWLAALQLYCEAEQQATSSGQVTHGVLDTLAESCMYLAAAATPAFGFEFQRRFLHLRASWYRLILLAQQYVGEMTCTSGVGGLRERGLVLKLQDLAREFFTSRSLLFGVPQVDADVFTVHGRYALLLAQAIEGFLCHQRPENDSLMAPSFIAEPAILGIHETCQSFEADVESKIDRFLLLSETERRQMGPRIMRQLLITLCSIPCALPRLFFRSRVPTRRQIRATAQFLTFSETSSFTSKPRTRSQLGVSFGTDFTCSVHCGLAIADTNPDGGAGQSRHSTDDEWQQWLDRVQAVDIEVMVKAANGGDANDNKRGDHTGACHVVRKCVPFDHRSGKDDVVRRLRVFVVDVGIPAVQLSQKGSYTAIARVDLLDVGGERWRIPVTGGRRGFIVY